MTLRTKNSIKISKLETLVSAHCWLCHQSNNNRQSYFCNYCYNDLPWIKHACTICGHPLDSALALACADCQTKRIYFDRCLCPWVFDNEIKYLIHAYKYHETLHIGKALSFELAKHINNSYSDHTLPSAILYVPLHDKKQRIRGFNQAYDISRHLERHLNIPVYNTLKRIKHTPSLHALSAEKRNLHLKNAFSLTDNISNNHRHIALIDDVITTGNTINNISKLLKDTGVLRIDAWGLARTLKQ